MELKAQETRSGGGVVGDTQDEDGVYAVHLPCRNRDIAHPPETTTNSVDVDADIDLEPRQYRIPSPPPNPTLFEAARTNDIATLTALLALGLPTEIETKDAFSPLTIAIVESHVPATRLLLQRGADPNHRAQRRHPLVHAALAHAHGPELMALLLEHGAVASSVSGPEGRNALHWAAGGGKTESVAFLAAQAGVDIEARCAEGHTAMTLAAEGGHEGVVRALWAAGADVSAKSGNGGTALHWASVDGDVGIVKFLVGKGVGLEGRDVCGSTALAMASHFGHAEVVEVLIAAGADVNVRSDDPKGCTPLMFAACADKAEVTKTLIAHGADLHALAADGNSTLDVALRHRCPEAVDVLLEAIGGEGYPKESVAVQFAMARERATIKALMATASVMHSHMEAQVEYAWIGWVLKQGGDLVKPLAMTKMLNAAVQEHDVGMVQVLVSHGCDVNRRVVTSTTPLGFAVTHRHLDTVQLLLEAGADPNQPIRELGKCGGRFMTPFEHAVRNMREKIDEQIVNSLLNSGRCRINQEAGPNATAFSFVLKQVDDPSARKAAIDLAERIVLSIQNVDGDRDDNGFTLLHIATQHRNLWMVDLLLDRGADIEDASYDGTTPFLLACQGGLGFAMLLVQRGANPKVKVEKLHASALHVMASQGQGSFTPLIELGLDINEQTVKGYTPLACALNRGHEAVALMLMENGAHVDWKTDENHTALHFAARYGMNLAVERILEHDVDVNAVDTRGWISLHEACATGNTAVVAQLLDAGADIERPLPNGDRPLHCALVNGRENTALLLLERGADFTVIASMKRTPLHMAADYGLPRAADTLLRLTNCSTIAAVDEKTWTPLCCTRSLAIMELLIKAGADVNYADEKGWTPLHLAVHEGDTEAALELILAGADLEARTKNDGLTVRERAVDLWSWSKSGPVIRPRLLQMAADRRKESQRHEEHETLGGPYQIVRRSD